MPDGSTSTEDRGALMGRVCPDTVKLYYEESKAARAQVEALLDKYRTEDVPSPVELRWRPGEHQAAFT
jgi:hypothetical protein